MLARLFSRSLFSLFDHGRDLRPLLICYIIVVNLVGGPCTNSTQMPGVNNYLTIFKIILISLLRQWTHSAYVLSPNIHEHEVEFCHGICVQFPLNVVLLDSPK
jgi:hypothetical protein